MTDKQKAYFETLLAKNKLLTEEQKQQFTKAVEATPKSKLFCIDYVKTLNGIMFNKPTAITWAHVYLMKGYSDPVEKFCAEFIASIYD